MTPRTPTNRQHAAPIVHWVLQRDANAITCQLDARGSRHYELCVMPHGNPSATMIERFDAAMPALLRHAEVARRLRENGWIVIDHVEPLHRHLAA